MSAYILRYGSLRLLGVFSAAATENYARNQQVLAKTPRGVELAEVLCEANDRASEDLQEENGGRILRLFNDTDRDKLNSLHSTERQIWEFCQTQIKKLTLEMRLIDVEQVFGGERILVYYLAENRVDFRELVKILAAEFGTRIEISGRCGRLKCCLRYEYETYQELKQELPPVGADIVTATGRGKVLGHEILASQLLIQTEDMRRILIDSEDILSVLSPS
jgi:cell fate regulator YaaT (PSP1 superfamily)